jgi:hypothetical protein
MGKPTTFFDWGMLTSEGSFSIFFPLFIMNEADDQTGLDGRLIILNPEHSVKDKGKVINGGEEMIDD